MARTRKERLVEGLAVASALGFLALVVAIVSLAAEASAAAVERGALADQFSAAGRELAARAGEPGFDRMYRLKAEGAASYAAVIALRSPEASALVAARFGADGGLQDLRLLGSCSSGLPSDPKGLAARFPDAAETLRRASRLARSLAASQAGGGS